jgi:pyridoxamine 5'-phosphate oxidase
MNDKVDKNIHNSEKEKSEANSGAESVADLRREYRAQTLCREGLAATPVEQFRLWFEQARAAQLTEPNAMTLATADAAGRVTARTVLLKAYDERGFVFFTNYGSRKAGQMAENPRAALLFPWLDLERQVAIEGAVEKISAGESLRYFLSRPRGSQLGAWVSEQSQVVSSRRVLEEKFQSLLKKFGEGEVPKPDWWGGYRVVPETVEFWQGGRNRIHDRFQYARENEVWAVRRLQP